MYSWGKELHLVRSVDRSRGFPFRFGAFLNSQDDVACAFAKCHLHLNTHHWKVSLYLYRKYQHDLEALRVLNQLKLSIVRDGAY